MKKTQSNIEHSPKYQDVYDYYNVYHTWGITAVRNAVKKGWIRADEFEEITGEPYESE